MVQDTGSLIKISIHALREEGDHPMRCRKPSPEDFYPRPPRGGRPRASLCATICKQFLSTPSARRATEIAGTLGRYYTISIHALREEGDPQCCTCTQ